MQQRTNIIKKVTERLNGYYGPSGSEAVLFRKVRRGPLLPVKVEPSATVTDNGQRSMTPADEVSGSRILAVRIVLHLAEDWTKVAQREEWQDNVELIIHKFQNWLAPACGTVRMDYQSDDPFDVVFMSGASQAVWVIDFDCHYFTEEELKDNWT